MCKLCVKFCVNFMLKKSKTIIVSIKQYFYYDNKEAYINK